LVSNVSNSVGYPLQPQRLRARRIAEDMGPIAGR